VVRPVVAAANYKTVLCFATLYCTAESVGQSTKLMRSGLMHLTSGACSRCLIFTGKILLQMSMFAV